MSKEFDNGIFPVFYITDQDDHTPRMVIPSRIEGDCLKLSNCTISQGDQIRITFGKPMEYDNGQVMQMTGIFHFNPESEEYPVLLDAVVVGHDGNIRSAPCILPVFSEGDVVENKTMGVETTLAVAHKKE